MIDARVGTLSSEDGACRIHPELTVEEFLSSGVKAANVYASNDRQWTNIAFRCRRCDIQFHLTAVFRFGVIRYITISPIATAAGVSWDEIESDKQKRILEEVLAKELNEVGSYRFGWGAIEVAEDIKMREWFIMISFNRHIEELNK